jgi:hypothetical protein
MKNTWLMIAVTAIVSLGSLAALTLAQEPAPPAATPAAAPEPATAPDDAAKEREPTAEEQADPDGGYIAPQASKPVDELPPDMRETADFDISFPIDI